MSDDVAVGGLDTPVGPLAVAVTRAGLASLGWGVPAGLTGRSRLPVVDDSDRTAPVLTQLAEYFAGQRQHFDVPIDWRHVTGSARTVLGTLHHTVGYGASVTYGELAARSGTGVPARGIGGIMGANPIPIVVPCHRVLAHDGLGGYSGGSGGNGLEVKRWLLTLEGVLPPTFDWNPARLTT
ncbi:methylated-DNA--[protein]-cysteine S-methyltransferase [Jiangella gansuensis]|uniref:methylated-DNA--[protein]-cysteine S-methyltransferase n=1 Tax=Jiangella gansuensis TaxID=281473 RepID=UPI00047A0124|nr:methylated-DNA--[protein]-cysteine S-methyltransferase [Jiangella gansuensis]